MMRQLFRMDEIINNGKKYLLGIILCVISQLAMAGTDPVVLTKFEGKLNEIVVNAERETIDPIYYSSNVNDIDNPANDVYLNVISLLIDEEDRTYIAADFTVTIRVEITWTDKNGNLQGPLQKDLEVDYKVAEGTKYNARNYFYFDNSRKVKVKIISIDTHGASTDVLKVLILENRMEVKRDYKFLCTTTASSVTHAIGDVTTEGKFDELIVSWTPQAFKGITHYDIEWSWVDVDALDRYKINGNFDADLLFRNNASRVTVKALKDQFPIPLIYDGTGHLFYRVRPVQYREDGQIVEGGWSATGTSGITYYVYNTGHEADLNWQVSTTYAEDGKHKTVIQYFDGTLRSRQTVTKDNVNNNTVVAETFYDYQGRPAINVLPSPTLNTVIEYAKNFNRFTGGGTDPRELYDLVPSGQTICTAVTPSLDNNYGVSKYYSPNNPKVNEGMNKYIPDAEGYPYAETRYTPDATGRIAAQGGVGPAYQLSSGHETKYFYGYADQKELNALFGTEVGHSSHYFKNMVRDANGQYSVSYVDMHGRTIATALAGSPPENLKKLDSYPDPVPYMTKNLLSNNLVKDRSIESSTTLLVPKAGLHEFHYELTPQSAEIIACNPPGQTVCYDCYYDLEIRITGTCGQTPIVITRKNFTFGNYDQSCATAPPALVVDESYTLAEGEYNITKTLTLSKDAQDWYRENVFAVKNICKTLEQFYNEIYEVMLENTNCNVDCATCEAALGTYEQYRTMFLQEQGIDPATTVAYEAEIKASYDEANANCQALCEEPESKLSSIRQSMLDDMTPDQGQYAKLDKDLDGNGEIEPGVVVYPPGDANHGEWEVNSTRPYNIFKHHNSNTQVASFRKPKDESDNTDYYKDEAGQPDVITPSVGSISPEDFSEQFGANWARSLLYYHPEYCKLKIAEQNLLSSYKWDTKVESTDTWSEAVTLGYMSILNLDPFFNGPGSAYKPEMTTLVTQNYRNNKSMWQFAIMSINCLNSNDVNCGAGIAAVPPYSAGTCTGDWNYVWRIFRTLYLSEKDRLVNKYLDAQCPSINYQALKDNKYERRFGGYDAISPNFTNLMNQLQAMQSGGNAVSAGNNYFNIQAMQQYTETCSGYIEAWKTKLLTCDVIYNHWDKERILTKITDGMKSVCIRGSDEDHPYGSSSAKTGDNVAPRSFEQVIEAVFAEYGITVSSLCHPYLVDYPTPYEHQTPVSNDIVLEPKDECVCKRIEELKQGQLNTAYTGTLSQFIQYQHGITIRQTFLDTLINGCNGIPNCVTYDPALSIPPILSCNTPINNCIDCKEYDYLKNQFKAKYPSFSIIYDPATMTEEQGNQNILFEKFMNTRSGLNKSWYDYWQFEKACAAHNLDWNCTKLDSIVTVFYQTHPAAGSGDSCRTAFTQYFNTAFGTSYTFAEIQSLFVKYCGHLPDVCEPTLDCKGFEEVIAGFYEQYGASITDSTNCQALFVSYFNNRFGTSYTWSELNDLFAKLCGGELNVCSKFPCWRLQQALDKWYSCSPVWTNSNCLEQWVNYFNAVMGSNLQAGQIDSLYQRCNMVLNACLPPADCKTLQSLLDGYHNAGESACPGVAASNCHGCFTAYINEKLGQNFSYEQILLMYQKSCGIDAAVCESNYNCKELSAFSANFIQWYAENPNAGKCDSLFTVQFNTAFSAAYDFEKIMAVYELYCGARPDVCRKETVLTCEQIDGIYNSFLKLYPDPAGYFGSGCDSAFAHYFNQAVNDTLSYADIGLYYGSLCGRILDICSISNCSNLENFFGQYQYSYDSLNLPQALRRDLFTHLYNKQYAPAVPHTWKDLERMYAACNMQSLLDDIAPADSSGQLLACHKLADAKIAFYTLYDNRIPEDCETVFTGMFNQYYETSFSSYQQLIAWASDNCGINYDLCGTPPVPLKWILRSQSAPPPAAVMPPRLCSTLTLFPEVEEEEGDPCDFIHTLALNAATEQYNVYLQSQYENFDSTYKAKCLSAANLEIFTVRSQVAEYHYTLYYYDQAGNLVKTVPPAGVHPDFSDNFYNAVEAAKLDVTMVVVPAHTLPTQYRYNTLGQVVAQKSPDGGLSKFWYDRLGRLVISQNAKQTTGNKYSYTKFDILGRITEVGQLTSVSGITQDIAKVDDDLKDWMDAVTNSREQITKTIYDEPEATLCASPTVLCQQNLRNRVSYTTLTDLATDASYASATYYTYDMHGNVDILLQHYNKGIMQTIAGNAFKKITYKYDLVSGKVNEVAYQPGVKDQFYHRYEYDAENKLIEAYTSPDYVYWERQAKYDYYRHGPLGRTELGKLRVQGIDYAYTLQGWMKGINTTAIAPAGQADGGFDMGSDGITVAKDAYGFSLNFNTVDYKSINNTVTPFSAISNGLTALADGLAPGKDLYNGNIKAMLVNIPKLTTTSALEGVKLYGYQYDQLNRITAMNAYNGLNATTNVFTPVVLDDYKERVTYDANGNIVSYLRSGTTAGSNPLAMDNMTYNYYANSNKLSHVDDAVTNTNYTTDIDDQETNNYEYDEIGNLIYDETEKITNIEWTVYRKIKNIYRQGLPTISYIYDAGGNRIQKKVGDKTTTYVRDASGNVMAVYESGNSGINSGRLTQIETHLYGSSRLGVLQSNRDVEITNWWLFSTTAMVGTSNGGYTEIWGRGKTVFELSNHLGNVLVTVSDKKIGVDATSPADGVIDYYTADVVTANDYYPGGMQMPGRTYTGTTSYRYGFNGKENDNEVKGEGNQQDYGMRIYDPRLARFLSVDPLTSSYPFYTPYQFAGNNPIRYIDLDGAEPSEPGKEKGERQTGTNGGETAQSWEWDGKKWNEAALEGVTVTGTKPKEGATRTAEKWFGSAGTGGGGGSMGSVTQYYHRGSSTYRTKGGWYEQDSYIETLQKVGADMAAATGVGHVNIPSPGYDYRVRAFLAEIGEPAEAFYGAMGVASKEGASKRNLYTSGYCAPSGFNVEDMLGVGLLMKGAIKSLTTATVYRNFGENELASLLKNQKFTFGADNFPKQFWLDKKSLDWWRGTDFAKKYTVKITVPKSSLRLGYRFSESGGQGNIISFGTQEGLDLFNKNMKYRFIK